MKLAFSSIDGKTISSHFGRSRYFVIVETSEGKILKKETRKNPYAKGHHNHSKFGKHHNHSWIEEILGDCDVVVTKGLGEGALKNLQELGKRVIITQSSNIEEVLEKLE